MQRKRLAVVAMRQDVVDHFGRLQVRQAAACAPPLVEEWLDAPEAHRALWVPEERLEWRLTPGGEEEVAKRKKRPGQPVTVAGVHAHHGGGQVFVERVPARMLADRAASTMVQQTRADGGVVVRTMHYAEVDRLFAVHPPVGYREGDAAMGPQGHRSRENVGPWSRLLGAVAAFFAVPYPTVPRTIHDVIAQGDVEAFRGGMGMAAKDYGAHTRPPAGPLHGAERPMAKRACTETARQAGGRPSAAQDAADGALPAPKRRGRKQRRECQPEGGFVFTGVQGTPMWLADYWVSHDINDVVPMEYVSNPERVVRSQAMKALAGWYPDAEVVSALAGDGVPSKDRFQPGVAMLGTNHAASITNHKFVDKMYATEMEAGRMSSYGVDQSPPCWPLLAAPTGCVDKALRDGSIDPLNKRPTADYSWPVRGHWMSHLCRSSNERVDLERDFPWVYMMGAHDLIEQIQYLAALGDGVR